MTFVCFLSSDSVKPCWSRGLKDNTYQISHQVSEHAQWGWQNKYPKTFSWTTLATDYKFFFVVWILWCVIACKISYREKIQKAPLPSVSLIHHQFRDCGAQWELRSFRGTAVQDQHEQHFMWGSTNLCLAVLNEIFICWSNSEIPQHFFKVKFNVFLFLFWKKKKEKKLENYKR